MKFLYILFIVFFSFFYTESAKCNDDIDVILERTKELIMENPSYFVDNPTDSSVAHIMGLINDDGMFADVDYSDSSITDWQPRLHCNRITVLSCAYVDPKSRWYNDHSLYSKIIKGIKAWYLIHPVSDNWWWNVINTQQQIGSTLILMRFGKEKVSSELETLLISRMKEEGGNPADYTAANRSDVALHCFYRGLLTMNEDLVQESVNYIYDLFVIQQEKDSRLTIVSISIQINAIWEDMLMC